MDIEELIKIMAALRGRRAAPGTGSRLWSPFKPFIVEEAYEVLEAIDEKDPEAVKENSETFSSRSSFSARSQRKGRVRHDRGDRKDRQKDGLKASPRLWRCRLQDFGGGARALGGSKET